MFSSCLLQYFLLRSTLRQLLPSARVTGFLRYYELIRLPMNLPVPSCFSTCSRTAVAESIGSHLSSCLPFQPTSPTSSTPEEDVNSHHNDLSSVAYDLQNSLGFLIYYISWLHSVQCVFRLGGFAPIRLTLTLPLRVQWVATGGWLDLAGQGFPAGITGVYQWCAYCPLLREHTKGNTHTLGSL